MLWLGSREESKYETQTASYFPIFPDDPDVIECPEHVLTNHRVSSYHDN
jgi:hypothetical protein